MPDQILSMGGGVQTTACLLRFKYTTCIFADTGDEHQEIYEHIETNLKPYCKRHGIKWITVRNPK